MDRKAVWTINIAGNMIPCQIHLHPPKIPVREKAQKLIHIYIFFCIFSVKLIYYSLSLQQFNVDINKNYKPKKAKHGHAPNVNIIRQVKSKENTKVTLPFQSGSGNS